LLGHEPVGGLLDIRAYSRPDHGLNDPPVTA
jgi:hypothetical protein